MLFTWNNLTSARSVGTSGCAGWYTRDSAAAEYDWPPFGSIPLPLPLIVVALSGVRVPCIKETFTAPCKQYYCANRTARV